MQIYAGAAPHGLPLVIPGTHFTCFTSTKVQILIPLVIPGTHFTCFTSTKVQILTPLVIAVNHFTRLPNLRRFGRVK
jgi:hypothetical protein